MSETSNTLSSIPPLRLPPGDVVNYQSPPKAPLIIPILFFSVLGFVIISIIIKLLITLWNRKRRSDTYVFVNANDDHLKLHYTVDNHCDPKSLPLTVISRKLSSNGNIAENCANNNNNSAHVCIEANVHDLTATNDENNANAREDTPLASNTVESDV